MAVAAKRRCDQNITHTQRIPRTHVSCRGPCPTLYTERGREVRGICRFLARARFVRRRFRFGRPVCVCTYGRGCKYRTEVGPNGQLIRAACLGQCPTLFTKKPGQAGRRRVTLRCVMVLDLKDLQIKCVCVPAIELRRLGPEP